jgi:general secretion pathway protein I
MTGAAAGMGSAARGCPPCDHAHRLRDAPVGGATILGRIRRLALKHGSPGGHPRATLPIPAGRGRGASHPPGFTLLEVLVALAILSLAVVVSIQAFAGGLRLLKLSGEHQEAMLIADQKAREVVSPTSGGIESGTEGAYAWEREVKIVATPDLDVEGRTVKWRVWEIDVRVKWGERRQVSIATLRTVAGDGDQPRTRP